MADLRQEDDTNNVFFLRQDIKAAHLRWEEPLPPNPALLACSATSGLILAAVGRRLLVFKDLKGDKYKIVSFYAKKARGQMARFIIEQELDDPNGLKKFRVDGYRYNRGESSARELVFTRDAPPGSK